LSFSKSNTGLTEFEKYLQSQAELQRKQKATVKKKKLIKKHAIEEEVNGEVNGEVSQKEGSKRNSPLKKSILLPKKRLKKEKLGTHSSDNWWQVLYIINITDYRNNYHHHHHHHHHHQLNFSTRVGCFISTPLLSYFLYLPLLGLSI